MTTSLSLYGTNVAATAVTTACKLATALGGTEVTVLTTSPNDSTQNYMEVLSQTGTAPDSASLFVPSGHGWMLNDTSLEGQTIPAGNWSGAASLNDSAGFVSIAFIQRYYKRSSAGVYTSIGSITSTAASLTATKSTQTFASSSMSAMSFGVGDKLYVDLIAKPATGTWLADPVNVYVSSNGAAGVANDMQVTTPGFNPTITDQPISPLEKIAVNDSVKADQTQFIIPIEKIAVKESVVTTVGLSPSVNIRVNDAVKSAITFTQIETIAISDSVVSTNTPVLPSGDPDSQMLNDDAEIMYVFLKTAPLTTAIAGVFLVRYPPAKVLSEHSIPTDLYVLLQGESFGQIHKLSTVNEVATFITDNS